MHSLMRHLTLLAAMGPVDSRLEQLASEVGWSVHQGDSLVTVIRRIIQERPAVLILQLDHQADPVRLSQWLITLGTVAAPAKVYAWAEHNSEPLERLVRSAGVHVYLSGTGGMNLLREMAGRFASPADCPVDPSVHPARPIDFTPPARPP